MSQCWSARKWGYRQLHCKVHLRCRHRRAQRLPASSRAGPTPGPPTALGSDPWRQAAASQSCRTLPGAPHGRVILAWGRGGREVGCGAHQSTLTIRTWHCPQSRGLCPLPSHPPAMGKQQSNSTSGLRWWRSSISRPRSVGAKMGAWRMRLRANLVLWSPELPTAGMCDVARPDVQPYTR